MDKKIFILLIVLVIISSVIGAVCFFVAQNNKDNNNEQNNEQVAPPEENVVVEEFVEVLDNGIKMNTSTKLKEKKVINGLEMDNIEFFMSNGQTYLKAKIMNNSGKDVQLTQVDIVLIDKEGNEISRMGGVIENLKNGEIKEFECITTLDFANSYDFRVEIIS